MMKELLKYGFSKKKASRFFWLNVLFLVLAVANVLLFFIGGDLDKLNIAVLCIALIVLHAALSLQNEELATLHYLLGYTRNNLKPKKKGKATK